ncbi:serine carboxypeptidase 1 isoform X2 [Lactuca sativa]|uniref:serine carboxypeptidase 1 isoform X2 n=1 Tax=Lactuca sativa TaxID=4236 RepID=UPI001C692930|nr:serine carboxypeptidase 1 isoform X2 [Lactuca sativa]
MIKILESIHLFLLIYLSFTSFLAQSAPQNAIVSQVPGFNGILPSKHYAGYVTLNENHGKKLYYYYVLSERDPSKDPVVLWLNGGPGCSSFDGFVFGQGPFDFEKTESMPKLHINPYAWNKVSCVIFLDSPVGVGMSYSRNRSDYITSDVITTLDSHKFLLEWFKLYPEYLSNPFFIAGEAFAGIYIPLLSDQVMKGLEAGDKPTLNFKGYIIGNGLCDEASDHNAIVPFAHGMGLISDELYQDVTKVCEGKFYKPPSLECEFQLDKVYQHLDGLNVDNIIKPCFIGKKIRHENTKLPLSFRKLGETERPLPVRTRMFGRAWPFKAAVKPGYAPSWLELLNATQIRGSPCSDDSVAIKWLNNEAVRKAIHADPISKAGKWEICTGRVKYNSELITVIDYHKKLTAGGYRALIYSKGSHKHCFGHINGSIVVEVRYSIQAFPGCPKNCKCSEIDLQCDGPWGGVVWFTICFEILLLHRVKLFLPMNLYITT